MRVAFLEASKVEPPIAETSHPRVPSISGQRQTTIPMHVDTNAHAKGVHLLVDRSLHSSDCQSQMETFWVEMHFKDKIVVVFQIVFDEF